jgi:hypothetical protein
MDFTPLFIELSRGFTNFTLGNAVMIIVGLILVYLAVAKEYEPVLLLPIGFGCILANLGMAVNMAPGACTAISEQNIFTVLYCAGIKTELFPLQPLTGDAKDGVVRRCRPFQYLCHTHCGHFVRVRSLAIGCDRGDRRYGWSNGHFCDFQTGT